MNEQSESMTFPKLHRAPLLIVLSGPSGVGKDAVLKRMKQEDYPLHYAVTLTTRPRRQEEREGTDYYFTSIQQFQQLIASDELLEWAQVYNNYYGVPRTQIREALHRGSDVLLKVDTQGAATIKELIPDVVLLFLMPPSLQELEKRLVQRRTEFPLDLERRLADARGELESMHGFEYAVVNHPDAIDLAVAQIRAILTAEKCRVRHRMVKI